MPHTQVLHSMAAQRTPSPPQTRPMVTNEIPASLTIPTRLSRPTFSRPQLQMNPVAERKYIMSHSEVRIAPERERAMTSVQPMPTRARSFHHSKAPPATTPKAMSELRKVTGPPSDGSRSYRSLLAYSDRHKTSRTGGSKSGV